ncbi:MAG: hypothetical protein Q9219_003635 [cf. Caloplaca sp. 3 TL-2023]
MARRLSKAYLVREAFHMCVVQPKFTLTLISNAAINKPKSISSAQVVRDIQKAFDPSKLFAPWLHAEKSRRIRESGFQQRRRRKKHVQVKVGHGGTLDPMATGVLIVGVGQGTKQLGNFLNCTKTYEATVLFGAATDTYDVLGKILNKAPYEHVTRTLVEEALERFRGPILQRPPLYSALHMDGKRLYEYAREGKEIPREIQERPVKTENLELREWLSAGSHQHSWPTEEAAEEEKDVADKVLHLGASPKSAGNEAQSAPDPSEVHDTHGTKRRRESEVEDEELITENPSAKRLEMSPVPTMSGALPDAPQTDDKGLNSATGPELNGQINCGGQDLGPPAARLSMIVTSGFYVRSFCHDLGKAVGSLGIMSELVRTRQADFKLGCNVLDYEDLQKGEEVWAPKVERMLDEWETKMTQKKEDDHPLGDKSE